MAGRSIGALTLRLVGAGKSEFKAELLPQGGNNGRDCRKSGNIPLNPTRKSSSLLQERLQGM